MAYASYKDYTTLYGEGRLDEAGFSRLAWEAERVMDDATTGVDGVAKLRAAKPTKAAPLEAVRRCACALVDTLRQLDETAEAIRKAQGLVENADGTVQGRMVASRSSGSESISYATGSAARAGGTVIDTAVSDQTARARLLDDLVRRYLAGVPDANGVNLLYMGPYPVRRGD